MDFDAPSMIHRARRDDPAALDELLGVYRNYLGVLAQVCLAGDLPSKLDPSDLVQETLMKAYQGFAEFQGHTELELVAWLRRILSCAVVDVVRRYQTAARETGRERSINCDVGDRDFGAAPDRFQNLLVASGSSPSGEAHRRELGVLLADALAELTDGQREVIILRSLKDLAWKDVAAAMDRTISSVRGLWLRGLAQLRERLEEKIS